MGGNGLLLSKNEWEWVAFVEKWVGVCESGWEWVRVAGGERKWMRVGESGWEWVRAGESG